MTACRYVELNPGEVCPLCADPLWDRKTPPGSEAHAVDARDRRDNLQCIERLKGVPHLGLTVADMEAMKPLPPECLTPMEDM